MGSRLFILWSSKSKTKAPTPGSIMTNSENVKCALLRGKKGMEPRWEGDDELTDVHRSLLARRGAVRSKKGTEGSVGDQPPAESARG